MTTFLLAAATLLLMGIMLVLAINIIFMANNPNFIAFPCITRCRLCDNRIYVWQRHERRQYKVKLNNPYRLLCSVEASGIVHKACKSTPETEVTVTVS